MTIAWNFHPWAAMQAHAAAWDGLNQRCGGLPFLESGFLLPLGDAFASPAPSLALCHDSRGRLVAAALLRRIGFGRWETWQPSQLPLGAWLAAPGEDPVPLARALLACLGPLALRLGLTQLDPQACTRPADGPQIGSLDYVQTGWIDIAGSFEVYWEGRGKNLRSNMRKQRSKLETDGTPLRFERITDPAAVPAAIADYGRLETAGWKAGSGTAIDAGNPQGRFYLAMMRNFCAAGRGEIWCLRFGEQVVAMDLCIVAGDTMVMLKTAFDPALRQLSPAFLLKQEALQQVFAEGRIKRIEFFGRLMEWHTRWSANARMLYHVNVDRWAWLPALQQRLRPRAVAAATLDPASGEPG